MDSSCTVVFDAIHHLSTVPLIARGGVDYRSGAVYYVGVAVAGGVVYLRFVRGWHLADMMYVTRSSLKSSVGQLSEGAAHPHSVQSAFLCHAIL